MEYRLFGDMEVCAAGQRLDVGTPRQQAVLAALLVDAGRPVGIETLIDRVWDDAPPVEARNVLYSHLSRLRQLLKQAAAITGETAVRIERRHAGYVLNVDPDLVDLHRFERLVNQGRSPKGADADRAGALAEALGLWRGPPLAALPGEWAGQVRASWHRLRLDAAVQWAQVELGLGHPAVVIPVLHNLVVEYPLVEPLEGLLMQALHAAGRGAEAIDRYAIVRQRLADELGADPSPPLRQLHMQILTTDPALGTPTFLSTRPVPGAAVPHQLPAPPRSFAGRTDELARLDALLSAVGEQPTAVVVSALSGMAGIGKTALAVHWAHQTADRFPDGQLYANLRGFDPGRRVMDPTEAVAGFLDALGTPAQRIPANLDAQTALYRSLLANKRVLVVLDNARDAEQVRPLLPGNPTVLVLVTSRNQLSGLVAADGAHPLTLDLLTCQEAHQLLAHRLGPHRLAAEPNAVDDIITRCARLPLALTIVAARAATHPHFPLTTLAAELRDTRDRLDALTAGEAATDIRAVFSWTYDTLTPGAARLFRLLGIHPGPDISTPAAASLAGLPLSQTRPLLAELTRANLIVEHIPGRYTFHDLLRAYATGRANDEDPPPQRRTALTRIFDYYLATTAVAVNILHPADANRRPSIPPPDTPTPAVTDPDTARAWLDTERRTLLAVAAHTATHGWPTHTTRLSATLFRYLAGGHHSDALTVHGHARDAAHHTNDAAGQAHALTNLGTAYLWLGRYGPAAEHFQQAVHLFRQAGDPARQARPLNNLGIVEERLGRYRPAADHFEQALTLFRQAGNRTGEAIALTNLGVVDVQLGRYRPAADHFEQALTLFRQAGNRTGEAWALTHLGMLEERLGRYAPAADHLQQALTLYRQANHRTGEAVALTNLGTLYTRLVQPAQAIEHHEQALAICREIGLRDGEAWALNGLGEAAHSAGRPADALTHHTAAHTIAADVGVLDQQARAHTGLGHAHHGLGNQARARHHYQQALTLYTSLGVPQADQIRAHLAALDNTSPEQR